MSIQLSALRRAGVSSALFLFAAVAQAQYLWIQPAESAGQAQVLAGELNKPQAALPALQDSKALRSDKAELPLARGAAAFTVSELVPSGDVRFTAIEPLADGVVYYHHAKLGRSETEAINDLELVPTEAGGNTFQLIWKGRPVAASLVNVDTSAGWRRQLTPDEDGRITLATPFPGLYVLEITVRIDDGTVTLDGKKYTDVRHNATLSFEVAP